MIKSSERFSTDKGADGRKQILSYSINFGRCIYCGLCAEVCPELAIVHGERIENASEQRAQYGSKKELLQSHAHVSEYGGFGSISFHADERVKATPLSYMPTTESSADSINTATNPAESSHTESAPTDPTDTDSLSKETSHV